VRQQVRQDDRPAIEHGCACTPGEQRRQRFIERQFAARDHFGRQQSHERLADRSDLEPASGRRHIAACRGAGLRRGDGRFGVQIDARGLNADAAAVVLDARQDQFFEALVGLGEAGHGQKQRPGERSPR
jgi:hypothetical protein